MRGESLVPPYTTTSSSSHPVSQSFMIMLSTHQPHARANVADLCHRFNVYSGLYGFYPMYVPHDDKEQAMPHYVSSHPYDTPRSPLLHPYDTPLTPL